MTKTVIFFFKFHFFSSLNWNAMYNSVFSNMFKEDPAYMIRLIRIQYTNRFHIITGTAMVAQSVRALASHAEGLVFKSLLLQS